MTKLTPIAIVGNGNVARTTYMLIWRKIKYYRVVAVCDLNRSAAERLAKEYNIPNVYESLKRSGEYLFDYFQRGVTFKTY